VERCADSRSGFHAKNAAEAQFVFAAEPYAFSKKKTEQIIDTILNLEELTDFTSINDVLLGDA